MSWGHSVCLRPVCLGLVCLGLVCPSELLFQHPKLSSRDKDRAGSSIFLPVFLEVGDSCPISLQGPSLSSREQFRVRTKYCIL